MKWWKRSITSNIDINGECNQIKEIYFDTDEELIYFSDSPTSYHHKTSIDILEDLIPNINIKIYFCNRESQIILVLEELIKSKKTSRIILCQWETFVSDRIDLLVRTLILKQDFLFLCPAGNRNVPFTERTPQRIKEVIRIGAYNRSGEIAALNKDVESDFYFPGTSIGNPKSNGTSWAVTIAAASFMIIKKWYQFPTNKKLMETYVPLHVKAFKDTKKRLILRKPLIRVQHRPTDIQLDRIGRLKWENNEMSIYIDHEGSEDSSLIDAMGQAISDLNRSDIVVPLSGGLDSESVAQACLSYNVDFTSVIMRYIYDGRVQNEFDFKHAIQFCEENNIRYRFIDLDCNWFFEESEEFLKYVTNYFTTSPQLCCHLWMLDQITGFPILGGDPIRISRSDIDAFTVQPLMYYCYDYYFHKTKKSGISRMLFYNSNIVENSIKIELELLSKSRYDLCNHKYERKEEFFSLGGFNLKHREKKYTGFEKLGASLNDKYNGIGMRIFNKFFRKTIQSIINTPKLNVFIDRKYRNLENE